MLLHIRSSQARCRYAKGPLVSDAACRRLYSAQATECFTILCQRSWSTLEPAHGRSKWRAPTNTPGSSCRKTVRMHDGSQHARADVNGGGGSSPPLSPPRCFRVCRIPCHWRASPQGLPRPRSVRMLDFLACCLKIQCTSEPARRAADTCASAVKLGRVLGLHLTWQELACICLKWPRAQQQSCVWSSRHQTHVSGCRWCTIVGIAGDEHQGLITTLRQPLQHILE